MPFGMKKYWNSMVIVCLEAEKKICALFERGKEGAVAYLSMFRELLAKEVKVLEGHIAEMFVMVRKCSKESG